MTIEPGVYFIPELMDLWRKEGKFTEFLNYDKLETYKDFGGIRNEEDYLITEDGARLLGRRFQSVQKTLKTNIAKNGNRSAIERA